MKVFICRNTARPCRYGKGTLDEKATDKRAKKWRREQLVVLIFYEVRLLLDVPQISLCYKTALNMTLLRVILCGCRSLEIPTGASRKTVQPRQDSNAYSFFVCYALRCTDGQVAWMLPGQSYGPLTPLNPGGWMTE